MAAPKAIVLRAAGTNCDRETAHALKLAGFEADLVHVFRVMETLDLLKAAQLLVVPGGFSYGDDVAAGKILANQMLARLRDPLTQFVDDGKLILGICNGFQVLLKSGLLPWGRIDPATAATEATLGWNDSDRFEARWIHLAATSDKCVFLKGLGLMALPVAHGEGKFITKDDGVLERLKSAGQVALRYVDSQGKAGGYPVNPNGSVDDIAGICDPSGRVLGLMPHPERFVDITHHPQWTRGGVRQADGLGIFVNAYRHVTN